MRTSPWRSDAGQFLRRLWGQIREFLVGDEPTIAAKGHLHSDLRHVSTRTAAYRTASYDIRAATIARLHYRAELGASGSTAPAASALVAVVIGICTLFGAFIWNIINAAQTGRPMTAADMTEISGFAVPPFLWSILVIGLIGLGFFWWARHRDRNRALATAWLKMYETSNPPIDSELAQMIGT